MTGFSFCEISNHSNKYAMNGHEILNYGRGSIFIKY